MSFWACPIICTLVSHHLPPIQVQDFLIHIFLTSSDTLLKHFFFYCPQYQKRNRSIVLGTMDWSYYTSSCNTKKKKTRVLKCWTVVGYVRNKTPGVVVWWNQNEDSKNNMSSLFSEAGIGWTGRILVLQAVMRSSAPAVLPFSWETFSQEEGISCSRSLSRVERERRHAVKHGLDIGWRKRKTQRTNIIKKEQFVHHVGIYLSILQGVI